MPHAEPPARPAPPPAEGRAAALRGFGPIGVLAILVILAGSLVTVVGAGLVLAWARVSRTPWRDLGFVRPRRWSAVVAGGIAFGVALKLAMKAVVMPLLGASPTNPAYQHLVGNPVAASMLAVYVVVGAGFAEETIYRGYLFERIGRLLGRGAGATIGTVLLTAALFGIAHVSGQGADGVKQAAVVGLVFGAIYAATRRIPFLMVAHAAFDLTAIAIIYLNLETKIAHLLFGVGWGRNPSTASREALRAVLLLAAPCSTAAQSSVTAPRL